MLSESMVYWVSGIALAVAVIGFTAVALRFDSDRRIYYAPAILVCALSSLSYFGMANDVLVIEPMAGDPMYMPRFIEYFITMPVMMCYVGYLAGVDRFRYYAAIIGGNAVLVIGIVMAMYLIPPISFAFFFSAIVATLWIAFLFFKPIARIASDRSGEVLLLFGKLRNLLVMLWLVYMLVGISARQALGFMDAFTGVFVGSYLDVLAKIGFGIILFRATDAIDDLVEKRPSIGASSPPEDGPEPAD